MHYRLRSVLGLSLCLGLYPSTPDLHQLFVSAVTLFYNPSTPSPLYEGEKPFAQKEQDLPETNCNTLALGTSSIFATTLGNAPVPVNHTSPSPSTFLSFERSPSGKWWIFGKCNWSFSRVGSVRGIVITRVWSMYLSGAFGLGYDRVSSWRVIVRSR